MTKAIVVAATAAMLAACGTSDTGVVSQTSGGEVAASVASGKAPAVLLVVDTTATEVRYRVRERLVGNELDNDAIGVTRAVTGQIALAADGSLVPEASKITINVTGLKSDQDRRDNFVRRRLLVTDSFPTVVFAPTAITNGPKTIPTSGNGTFTLVGTLTVRGVTKPTTWTVAARYLPTTVLGSASTAFTFKDFTITQPRVPILLSVSDTIKLEGDFAFTVKK
jgi:polyisoprenoid-binding protein YceI